MIRHILTLFLLLLGFGGTSHAGPLACLPRNVPGGAGTYAVASVNTLGAWAGWYCGAIAEPQIIAVSKARITATHQVLLAAALSGDLTLADINGLIQRMARDDINGPVLKPVWYPERDKLKAVRELPAAVYLQPAASASGAQQ